MSYDDDDDDDDLVINVLLHLPGTLCFRRCLSVCLFVSNFGQKLQNRFA